MKSPKAHVSNPVISEEVAKEIPTFDELRAKVMAREADFNKLGIKPDTRFLKEPEEFSKVMFGDRVIYSSQQLNLDGTPPVQLDVLLNEDFFETGAEEFLDEDKVNESFIEFCKHRIETSGPNYTFDYLDLIYVRQQVPERTFARLADPWTVLATADRWLIESIPPGGTIFSKMSDGLSEIYVTRGDEENTHDHAILLKIESGDLGDPYTIILGKVGLFRRHLESLVEIATNKPDDGGFVNWIKKLF